MALPSEPGRSEAAALTSTQGVGQAGVVGAMGLRAGRWSPVKSNGPEADDLVERCPAGRAASLA